MTDLMPHWLPERHLGVAATLSHADELIEQVAGLLFDYQTQPDEVIGLAEVAAGSISRTVVTRVAPLPRKVSLLVADALLAFRAALEHVLFAEVEFLESSPLGEKAAKLVELPAFDHPDGLVAWTGKRAKHGPSTLRSGSELVRRIEGLQPFQRTREPQLHPLARLVLHTNHAKHRTPAVTAVRIAAMYVDHDRPRSVRDLPSRPEEPVRVGDVIAETPTGVPVPTTLFPTIGVNRPGTDRWPVLMQELDEIAHWVRTQAVPRLITGGEPPEPTLPVRYATSIGHADELAAIAAGSTVSSAERHQQRLSAAAVRADLVGLIGRLEGSPPAKQIAAWLAQLDDGAVLERISRLQATETYDPDVVVRNFEVLRSLRDEALAHG